MEAEAEGADYRGTAVSSSPHLGSKLCFAYPGPPLMKTGSNAPYSFGEQLLKFSGGPLFLRGNAKGSQWKEQ